MFPVSLLAEIIEIKTVSGQIAERSSSGLILPEESTPIKEHSIFGWFEIIWQVWSIEGLQKESVDIWLLGLR